MKFNYPNHNDPFLTSLHPYNYKWEPDSSQNFDEDDSEPTPSYEDYNEFFSDYEGIEPMDFQQGAFYDDYPDPERFTKEDTILQTTNENNPISLEKDKAQPLASVMTKTSSAVEPQSKLIWNKGNEWSLKRDYFSFNRPSASDYKNRQVTLNFNQKEWDHLNDICERFGMPIEDYLECCALKIQPLPFAATNNQELWKRLLCFQDKMEQFETMLEFCSNDLRYNIFHSKEILHYWLCRVNDAHDQLDTFFNLIFLFGRDGKSRGM